MKLNYYIKVIYTPLAERNVTLCIINRNIQNLKLKCTTDSSLQNKRAGLLGTINFWIINLVLGLYILQKTSSNTFNFADKQKLLFSSSKVGNWKGTDMLLAPNQKMTPRTDQSLIFKRLQSDQHIVIKSMTTKTLGLPTMEKELSCKVIQIQNHPDLRGAIRDYFIKTYRLYEQLFQIISCDEAYYLQPEPLRHPLIFYFGHTACVYINKLIDYGIITDRVNSEYEIMFAVGVDQYDWDDLNPTHHGWPSVAETRKYREQVKTVVLNAINSSSINKIQTWHNDLWVFLLGIEHERIHFETSAVIVRRLPATMVKHVEAFVECPNRIMDKTKIPKNQMAKVSAWKGAWNRSIDNLKTYGWDNQFGEKQFDVKEFHASKLLVSNGEYLGFIEDGGYLRPELWTEEGQNWLLSIKPQMPLFWRKQGDSYLLKTLFHQIVMPWDWPAEVNNLEARAFCRWRTQKTGRYTRLPMEDEYYALRSILKEDQPEWGYQQAGNINLEIWMSPNPVDMFKTGDFCDIVGNVWQHTLTPIYPFDKFQIHPAYEDFATPGFDNRHDMMCGGSFLTTGTSSLSHNRLGFRRHFQQFAGFRYVESEIQKQIDIHTLELITDLNVEMNLRHHYLNPNSYVLEVVEKVKEVIGGEKRNHKSLTVGCSVGRIPLELGKIFNESIGIDYTARYFHMSMRLKETGFLKFKDIDIDLKNLSINEGKVYFMQMNPQNPDQKKLKICDWIIIDGYSIKKGTIGKVLYQTLKMAQENTVLAIISVSGVNEIGTEEVGQLITKVTGGKAEIGEETRLKVSDSDQSYLPGAEHQMVFKLNFFRVGK